VISPHAERVTFPTLLDFPAPVVRASTRETVIAEKTQAMVVLGIANSRMKDFFDVHQLSQRFPFAGKRLSKAITATFTRRKTALPEDAPLALTDAFATDRDKRTQWGSFLRKGRLAPIPLETVIDNLREFLLPVIIHAHGRDPDPGAWVPGGPWHETNIASSSSFGLAPMPNTTTSTPPPSVTR
jgi:hypothetical protein